MSITQHHIAEIQEAARCLSDGREHEAVHILEALTQDFPGYVSAYVLLAKAYEAVDRVEEALSTWHTAHLLMPGSPLITRRRASRMNGFPSPKAFEFVIPDEFIAGPPAAEEETWDIEPDIVLGSQQPIIEEPKTPPADIDWRVIDEIEDTFEPVTADVDVQLDVEATAPNVVEEEVSAEISEIESEQTPSLEGIEDLDDLISSLENAPPIRPGNTDPDEFAEPNFPEVVSETLARIYETQKQYGFAARVYEKLAEEMPHRADEFRAKAASLRARAQES